MAKRHFLESGLGWQQDDDYHDEMYSTHRRRTNADARNNHYYEAFGNYSGGYHPRRLMDIEFQEDNFFPPLSGTRQREPKCDHEKIKFLMRCGVPKETLRGLPSELLELYEPDNCGLCCYQLDTPHITQLHYVSKNHLKKQKKWLQHPNRQSLSKLPLRARELYCELCDVHITSTSHAKLHYEGKPHRAIVEGRRVPKNPALLPDSAAERIEKLIKREKRYMNIPEKSVPTDSSNEQTNENIQVLAGPKDNELYCNICKVFMVNFDQMTVHLNGRKHLSKEKQHILKIMRGEITETVGSPNNKDNENKTNLEEKTKANLEQTKTNLEQTKNLEQIITNLEQTKTNLEQKNNLEQTNTNLEQTKTKQEEETNDSEWGEGTESWEL
ncbi:uncharacterized protein LOC114352761 [Ostrinia furnacalis]|uniref:uncharacterized protein LOC114352761 n=1 Tax=Ostrinia furnacalis TaxID=93504 RepID=UPI00103955A6|nr:uncharacterized protein LOC114352761 [Ostrinia furnacalis]XP_028160273.1 uncharacterized protein LOC114352761 [Ostrinia furnacalis]XP_028160274.1 uncharacterized protein LOC114352761 [Ostrinia furnacalis]